MPVNEYSKTLSKIDPLTTIHLKVPQSIIPIFTREADDRQRAYSFVMREQLIQEAQRLAMKHEATDKKNSKLRKSGNGMSSSDSR